MLGRYDNVAQRVGVPGPTGAELDFGLSPVCLFLKGFVRGECFR